MLFFFLGPILSLLIPQRTIDKQVFPSLEFIGWYTVAPKPTTRHIALHDQVCSLFTLITSRVNNASIVHRILLDSAAVDLATHPGNDLKYRCQCADPSF
jgi:hypothetical protein